VVTASITAAIAIGLRMGSVETFARSKVRSFAS
jgi:hypothetical protein